MAATRQAMITEVFIAVDQDEVYRATLPPGEYVIGRDETAEIRIDHPTVSRRHAKLIVEESHLVLADLESGNGTMIEETPVVAPSHLYEGQTARFGDVLLRARQNVTAEVLPTTIRNYLKGEIVAAGGMGAIHEARQSAMGRKVAMKVMLRSESESGLRRFINEARITGMLEHPNIVPVHELGIDGEGRAFYTMKFVHGTTLAEVLAGVRTGHEAALKKYPLPFLLTVFQKVCDAIAFAHSRGVHHRDLKPENVMIGDFGEVLVMDWGLCKEKGFAGEAEDLPFGSQTGEDSGWRTMEGSVLGTPAYMSPEQARGEIESVDERSDVYALGGILHEILYLQPPVAGSTATEIVEKVARGELDPPQEMQRRHLAGGKVPASLEAVRRKAMALEPERRYARVQDLQADIAAYQAGFATSAEGAGLGKQVMLLIKRNKGVSSAVAAILAILVGGSVWFTLYQAQALRREAELSRELQEQNEKLVAEERARQEAEEGRKRSEEGMEVMAGTNLDLEGRLETTEERQRQTRQRLDETRRTLEETAAQSATSARRAVADGRAEDAVQLMEAAVQKDPGQADYLADYGRMLLATGEFVAAARQFELARQADPAIGVEDELKLTMKLRSLTDPRRQPSPEVLAELDRFFYGRGRPEYVRLVDTLKERGLSGNDRESAGGAGLIKRRLGKIVTQVGWDDGRIVALDDGGWALDLRGLDIDRVPDLVGTEVLELDLRGTDVDDLSPLRGLSLRKLALRGTAVTDLSPLRNMPELRDLECAEGVEDLGPLSGMPLETLDLSGSGVTNLEPLSQARLRVLKVNECAVQTLEPVAGQPLEELEAEAPQAADLSAVASMTGLRRLTLPGQALALDLSGLRNLEQIFHPSVNPDRVLTGEEFFALEKHREDAWQRYGRVLQEMGLPGFGPDKLVVRETNGNIDLDLRGTEIGDLRVLARWPLRRLFLDTSKKPLDIAPLASHETLQHLSLEGAYVTNLGRVAENKQLVSIVVSRDTVDTGRLAENRNVQWIGYVSGEDGFLPSGSREEFFAPRTEASSRRRPLLAFQFDNPAEGAQGWRIDDTSKPGPAALWTADPIVEGGRGGGQLTFYERRGNSLKAYFDMPSSDIQQIRRYLQGGLLEFQIRVGREVKETERVTVILEAPTTKLYHVSEIRPGTEWQTVLVSLSDEGAWSVNNPNIPPTTRFGGWGDFLTRLYRIKIQAEYAGGSLDERTDLDDVRFWDAAGARDRRAELELPAR